jgi:hypothetical protein
VPLGFNAEREARTHRAVEERREGQEHPQSPRQSKAVAKGASDPKAAEVKIAAKEFSPSAAGPHWSFPWNKSRWDEVNQTVSRARTTIESTDLRMRELQLPETSELQAKSETLRRNVDGLGGVRFGAKNATRKATEVATETQKLEAQVQLWERAVERTVSFPEEAARLLGEVQTSLGPGNLLIEVPLEESKPVLLRAQALVDAARTLRSADDDLPQLQAKLEKKRGELESIGQTLARWKRVSGALRDLSSQGVQLGKLSSELDAKGNQSWGAQAPSATEALLQARCWTSAARMFGKDGASSDQLEPRIQRAVATGRQLEQRIQAALGDWDRASTSLQSVAEQSERLETAAQRAQARAELPFGIDGASRAQDVAEARRLLSTATELKSSRTPVDQLETQIQGSLHAARAAETRLEAWRQATEALAKAEDQFKDLVSRGTGALPGEDPAPFDVMAEPTRALRASLARVEDQANGARGKVLTAQSAQSLAGELQRASTAVEAAISLLSKQLGMPPRRIEADPKSLERLPAPSRQALAAVLEAVPQARPALELLATARPEVLTRVDPVTGKRLAEQLGDFVRAGVLLPDEAPGLAEFIRRIAVRRFDWRAAGFNPSVTSSMNTLFNHPGLILDLVAAARADRSHPVSAVYEGDGTAELGPRTGAAADFKAGFRQVGTSNQLPGSALGYERGFLRAVQMDLAPDGRSLPRDRLSPLHDSVAVGVSKLTGQEVRYGHAFNLKTGQDLVDALQTQKGEGLAFGEIGADLGSGMMRLSFPVFYDFDPQTRTVAMQEWTRSERRIPVDAIRFDTCGNGRPSVFYRPDPGVDRFLTPQTQANWPYLQWRQKVPAPFTDSVSVQTYDATDRLKRTKGRSATAQAFGDVLSSGLAGYRPEQDAELKRAVERSAAAFDLPDAPRRRLTGAALAVAARLDAWPAELPPDVKRILVSGVAFKHGSAEEPLVGATSALDAAAALSALKPEAARAFQTLWDGAKKDVERALLLKALAARSGDLLHGDQARSARAMREIAAFAGIIRGVPGDVLLARSTVIHANASLGQKHVNGCVGASSILALSAADPYVAWVLNSEQGSGLQTGLERAILSLDRKGDRSVTWDFPKPKASPSEMDRAARAADLIRSSSLTVDDRSAFLRLFDKSQVATRLEGMGLPARRITDRAHWDQVDQIVAQPEAHFPDAARAVSRLQTIGSQLPEGFRTTGEILSGTIGSIQSPAGVAPDHGGNTYLSPYTHLDYNRVKYLYRLEGDPFHSERLAQVIGAGQKVLLRRGDPEDLPENYSHCITAYSVRGEPGSRSFYIVDSADGTGRWITQAEFESAASRISYFFGDSSPTPGVGRKARGRPEL